MMQPLYGGAAARPFVTHHNTLDIDLYLRIAPELYLKRLVVGGMERVYEINRNFRNEGLSKNHNPEFTMLEFYQAYTDYQGLMDFTAELLAQVASTPTAPPPWNSKAGRSISAASSATPCAKPWSNSGRRRQAHAGRCRQSRMAARPLRQGHARRSSSPNFSNPRRKEAVPAVLRLRLPRGNLAALQAEARRPHPGGPLRIFAAGMEIGNAFTELNDPQEQRRRFEMQLAMRERGDEEAHQMDEDYVRALSYGMPPAGGEGIGIDRLTMILTNSRSIRDVILFPLLRPEGPIELIGLMRELDKL
jgi:lysyl-tRNA synthetase, class II